MWTAPYILIPSSREIYGKKFMSNGKYIYITLPGNICQWKIYTPLPSPAPSPNIRGRLADTEFWPYIVHHAPSPLDALFCPYLLQDVALDLKNAITPPLTWSKNDTSSALETPTSGHTTRRMLWLLGEHPILAKYHSIWTLFCPYTRRILLLLRCCCICTILLLLWPLWSPYLATHTLPIFQTARFARFANRDTIETCQVGQPMLKWTSSQTHSVTEDVCPI